MSTNTVGALGLTLVGRGELAGTWDVPVNDNFRLIEQSTSGYFDIGTISGPYTLPVTGTTTDPSKAQVIKVISTVEGALITMPNPNTTGYSKTYFIVNAGAKSVTVIAGGGSTANVPGNSMSTVVVTYDTARSDTSNAVFGNQWTLAAPNNTAWMKLIGSTGGGNANAFIGFYTGDLSSSALRGTLGYAGTTDLTIDSYDNVLIRSTKSGSAGTITVGGGGATVTGYGGSTVTLNLTSAFGNTDAAKFTYTTGGTHDLNLLRNNVITLQATDTTTTIFKNGAALLTANATSTTMFSGASGGTVAFTSGTGCNVSLKGQDSNAPTLEASTDSLTLYRTNTTTAVPVLQASSSSSSLHSPNGAPVIDATSTTLQINSGNGAPAISLDGTSSTIKVPSGNYAFNATNTTVQISRNGYQTVDLSATGTRLYDHTNAPLLAGLNTSTTLYRNGAEVFRSDGADIRIGQNASTVALKSGAACVLEAKGLDSFALNIQASSDVLNLYRNTTTTTSPVVLANATNTQLFSPVASVITATSTTLQINSGNGAPAISIDSTGVSTFNKKITHLSTSAGATVDGLHLQNGAGSAGSAVRISLDPGASGIGSRDAQIVATNSGANIISLAFFVAAASTPAEAARFSGFGNLLLGTTIDSGYKLDVAGTCRFNGVAHDVQTVNGTGKGRLMKNVSAGNITSGSTAAGSALSDVYFTGAGVLTAGSAPTGTWKNITNRMIVNGETGEWLRIS